MADFDRNLTLEQLHRIEAWLVCLNDSLAYIALAQNRDNSFAGNKYFKYACGMMNVEHAMSRALISAAIVSAGQVFNGGGRGRGIADNQDQFLNFVRARLFFVSDTGNKWKNGRSESIFEELIRKPRNQFLCHFDGSAANAKIDETTGDLTSWRPPNPWFIPEKFLEVESMFDQMHRSLRCYSRDQRHLLKGE